MGQSYSIRRYIRKCRTCGNQFYEDYSNDNSLVGFYIEDELVRNWMNMYGENGYNDLLEKLMNIKYGDNFEIPEIIMFQEKLSEIANKKIVFHRKRGCPKCDSIDIHTLDEQIITTEDIKIMQFPFR